MTTSSRTLLLAPIVILIIGALVIASRSRPAGSQPVSSQTGPADDSPESCMTRLLTAERAANMPAYLDCFSEEQRAELRDRWRAQSDRQAAAELRGRSAGMVGHAISDVALTTPDRASLVLERIEKDHTSRQRVDLQRIAGRWLITRLATADWQRPSIPYGTPVFTPQRDAAQ